MGKLNRAEIDRYFEEHLPYRIGVLLAHYRMTRVPWVGDVGRLNACFVASLVTGRLFLNVLGIGRAKNGGGLAPYEPKPDDVNAVDLGGVLIDPAALPKTEQDLLLNFLRMADKAAAHFTIPIAHDWGKTHEVILRIHHYLGINLYGHTGRKFQDATP
jgi:hypothetical protein